MYSSKIVRRVVAKFKKEYPEFSESLMIKMIERFHQCKLGDILSVSFFDFVTKVFDNLPENRKINFEKSKMLYNCNGVTILTGYDQYSCIKNGKNTSWCISANSNSEHYEQYRYYANGTPYFVTNNKKRYVVFIYKTSYDMLQRVVNMGGIRRLDFNRDSKIFYSVTDEDNDNTIFYSSFSSMTYEFPFLKGLRKYIKPYRLKTEKYFIENVYYDWTEEIDDLFSYSFVSCSRDHYRKILSCIFNTNTRVIYDKSGCVDKYVFVKSVNKLNNKQCDVTKSMKNKCKTLELKIIKRLLKSIDIYLSIKK